MASQPHNLFFSFRARLVLFVMLVLFVTIIVLLVMNRHAERRIAQLVSDHHRDTSLAVDLAQSSFPSGSYIYRLLEQDGRLRVGLDESHIIHRILIADAEGRIIDSSERADIDQPIGRILGELTPAPYAKPSATINPGAREPEQILSYPVETERGIRRVVIVISPHLLEVIVREEERERWLILSLLGVLLVVTVSLMSWRFTRPIHELVGAARFGRRVRFRRAGQTPR